MVPGTIPTEPLKNQRFGWEAWHLLPEKVPGPFRPEWCQARSGGQGARHVLTEMVPAIGTEVLTCIAHCPTVPHHGQKLSVCRTDILPPMHQLVVSQIMTDRYASRKPDDQVNIKPLI